MLLFSFCVSLGSPEIWYPLIKHMSKQTYREEPQDDERTGNRAGLGRRKD